MTWCGQENNHVPVPINFRGTAGRPLLEIDSAKQKFSLELERRRENMKVHLPICSSYDIIICYCGVKKFYF
jgi:hypothetical protein